jgi:hypothetical protein
MYVTDNVDNHMIFGQHKHYDSYGSSHAQDAAASGIKAQYQDVDPDAGYRMVTWDVDGVEYCLMGNVSKEDMFKVVEGLV